MKIIRTFEAFAGYGSQLMALRRLEESNPNEIKIVPVGISEIEPNAIKAYHAVHGENVTNYGDISKIDWAQVPDFDLFTYSSPCQDFSAAGLQRGGEKGSGTRSSLLWECEKAISIKRPRYCLMENVAALVSQKFIKLFQRWMLTMEGYGYKNFAQVLNAKDYGVPQNRARIFLVSILDDEARYSFPKPQPLHVRLKDVLEPKVDEKYYLSDKMVESFLKTSADESHNHNFQPKDGGGTERLESSSCKIVGRIWKSRQNGLVYDPMGIAPCQCVGNHSGVEPKIIEI